VDAVDDYEEEEEEEEEEDWEEDWNEEEEGEEDAEEGGDEEEEEEEEEEEDEATSWALEKELRGQAYGVTWCAWSPAGTGPGLALTSANGTVRVIDVSTGIGVVTFVGPGGAVRSCAWSPDGRGLHSFTFRLNVSAFCGIRRV